MTNITFISASAGSGKTHRITDIIEDRLSKGVCCPGGLIATTYTVKAAQELRERIERSLHRSGHPALAERLHESLIGTVHGVCARLLERFAFEGGISPRIAILAEEDAAALLIEAIETAGSYDALHQLQQVADRLGQKSSQTFTYAWKRQVRDLLDAARANDLRPEFLPLMAEQSCDELLSFLPPAAVEDLDVQLAAAIRRTVEQIAGNGDDTKTTAKYVEMLRDGLAALEANRLAWGDWVRMARQQPAKQSQAGAAAVASVVNRVESHPGLRKDIRAYTELIFSVARHSWSEFQRLKEERGLLDFCDLEQRTFQLLRDKPQVRESLELDLFVVDEFQDTSPLQLGLFMQLAAHAREVVWVGDVKQAIYGFRHSDPELIKAVVQQLQKFGPMAEPLAYSWRSTPDLVGLTNALFVPAFERSLGLPAKQVHLQARRGPIAAGQVSIEFFELSSGQRKRGDGATKRLTGGSHAYALAEGIAQLVGRGDNLLVQETQESNRCRPVEHRDVAVLCRTNQSAAAIAAALTERGFPVTLSQPGLMATPEVKLALACLRRLADPTDSLAAAEIVALGETQSAESWLESRLKYVTQMRRDESTFRVDRWGLDGECIHVALCALEKARPQLDVLSPREALDVALQCGAVLGTVSAWGPTLTRASQRRANLESLRGIAVKYEQASSKNCTPATIAGYLAWCDFLAESQADLKAADERLNAIFVSTYHQAKGLEWPIVVCTDLDTEPRPRLWEATVVTDAGNEFSVDQPLANRRVRFWPWPFGMQATGIDLSKKVHSHSVGQGASRQAEAEDLRLLYVGLTRARDLLVLVSQEDQPTPWLDLLQSQWLQSDSGRVILPAGTPVGSKSVRLMPPGDVVAAGADSVYHWFGSASKRTPKAPARLTPSQQFAHERTEVGRIIEIAPRLGFSGAPNEADMGDALHAVLAAEFVNPGHVQRLKSIRGLLKRHQLENHFKPEPMGQMADRFRAQVERLFRPRQVLVEVPISTTNEAGQRIAGVIDLLMETPAGWVLIDHKSFPGKRAEWMAEAISHSGQLAFYRGALRALNLPVAEAWIHFAIGGGMVELLETI